MAKLKKPVSRLILLFILMVVVSGVILTFLSINNISNLRMLTEKRVQETQHQIAGQIANKFQDELNQIAEEFSRDVSKDMKPVPADFQNLNNHKASILPFVLNHEKNFIYPWFFETGQNLQLKQSASILPDFTFGETDEFRNEDYQKALEHYLSALGKSRTPGDSAKIFNAIGRVSSKLKQFDKAYLSYSSLFPRLSKEISPGGTPYSYFAINQLIKLPFPVRQQETALLILRFLGQTDDGAIPLNPGTKVMLEDITTWFKKLKSPKEQEKNFSELTGRINSKLDFISSYAGKIREAIESGRQSELPELKKNFSTFGFALVLLLGGMFLGIILILRDINREKKISEMQSEFVANVTHELKTPLTSISMFAETIFLDRAKSEDLRKKYSNIIMKESNVLKRKIDNILEYSVRKDERSKYRYQETNLSLLVNEVIEEMKYWLDINSFEVYTEIEEDVFARIDQEAIRQTITNLIGNAIKYSPFEKRLVVSMKKVDYQVFIEVADSGIGIPKDQIDLVFEKFYRVRSDKNDSTTGTGLGLSVTRDIVKAHKGEVSVESEINKGSKFTILLYS